MNINPHATINEPVAVSNRPQPAYGITEHDHSSNHGMSWAAIIAGVFLSCAVAVVLLILGGGLGLSTISPWAYPSEDAVAFSVKAMIWLIVVQWVSSSLGGYLAGRLRCKWRGLNNDEVFFRDTAHGLSVWAVTTVLMTGLLASSGAAIIGGVAKSATTVTAAAAMGAAQNDENYGAELFPNAGYSVDALLRLDPRNPKLTMPNNDDQQRLEIARLLATAAKNDNLSQDDRSYLSQLVAVRAGISPEEADKRVDAAVQQINQAKEVVRQKAEQARKMAMKISMYLVLSMLIGAFVASVSAAYGGRLRDEH